MVKIFIEAPVHMQDALRNGLRTLLDKLCDFNCREIEEAGLVIVQSKQRLADVYNERQYFGVLSVQKVEKLPVNAHWIPLNGYLPMMLEYLPYIESELLNRNQALIGTSKEAEKLVCGKVFLPKEYTRVSQRILVVDDRPENRRSALELLQNENFVTLASGYREASRLIEANIYDILLSDCQMQPETENSSLSVENIVVGETVPNGLFLIFLATKRGARVAIVTDANHHEDWVSAIFDDKNIQEPQNVNGRPVLLINYMGKRWDKALEKILSLE